MTNEYLVGTDLYGGGGCDIGTVSRENVGTLSAGEDGRQEVSGGYDPAVHDQTVMGLDGDQDMILNQAYQRPLKR